MVSLFFQRIVSCAGERLTILVWYSHPEEFPCVIVPRDEEAVRLIEGAK